MNNLMYPKRSIVKHTWGTSQFHCKKCGKTEERETRNGKIIYSDGYCSDCLVKLMEE